MLRSPCFFFFFFFNDTATTEIYTLSLHDALPISRARCRQRWDPMASPVVIDFLVRGMPDVSRAMRTVEQSAAAAERATTRIAQQQANQRQRLVDQEAKAKVRALEAAEKASRRMQDKSL